MMKNIHWLFLTRHILLCSMKRGILIELLGKLKICSMKITDLS